MKFSVVIPLYNKVNHIQRAIDSVLNQSVQDFECIVVNDGSTDGSEKVVEKYTDTRVRLINQKNGGEAAARNKGIKNVNGSFVAFLDADDAWEESFLDIISELISAHPSAGIFATALKAKEADGQLTSFSYDPLPSHPWCGIIPSYFECISNGTYPLSSSTTCIKREVLPIIGDFDPSLKIGADIDMWARAALTTEIAFSSKIGAVYYRDAENRSNERTDFNERELDLIKKLERYSSHPGMTKDFLRSLNLYRAKKIKSIIIRYILIGKRLQAISVFLQNKKIFKYKERVYLISRLLSPNSVINIIKRNSNI